MHFTIYILSNQSEKYWEKARKEYEKRLSKYWKVNVKQFRKPEKLQKEWKKQCQDPSELYPLVIIDPTGQQMSSEKLANTIGMAEMDGISDVNIVISEDMVEVPGADALRYAVSRMDFSAGLTSVIVLEQIYRAFKILRGETYHK